MFARLIFNPSTPSQRVLHEWSSRQKLHAGGAHLTEQSHTLFIHKIHFAQINDGLAAFGGGGGRVPALSQFLDPKTGQAAFEAQSELAGRVMKRDLEHTRNGVGARAIPEVFLLEISGLSSILVPAADISAAGGLARD